MTTAAANKAPSRDVDLSRPKGGREAAWDAFLGRHPFGHHEQSSLYGQLRSAYGYDSDRVILKQGGEVVGGAQVMWRSTPIGRIGIVQRGPLSLNDDAGLLAQVMDQLDGFAREHRISILRVETFAQQHAAREVLVAKGFESRTDWWGEHLTSRIEVSGSDQDVLARMKPKGRYNIRLARRLGVEVRTGSRDSLDEFYALYSMSAAHKGFGMFDRAYFEYLLDVFGPSGRVQQFVAYHDNRPVAALFNTVVGEHMLYGWGGVDRSDDVRKLMAGYLLHFKAMQWARDHGCRFYDLLGISETSTGGLTRFKTRIAPEHFRWPVTMWKYYGPLASVRSTATQVAWSMPTLRNLVIRAGRRLGLHETMPW
ncbi:peptidoglycan bridge formation glycyltransferase FemA/FemB family protein [Thioalkalivibrio sp. XN279]|uniref:lipid II:glycine glycyltransferase FemX n=1 Tax=Thioalkalivibrio sp. XN279 TaxID=2714953 RepID=UPI00140B4AA7|nr:peptidoglycan bridge formation glycyltransferase FemA/FemB family protein [Thioalkalivibrio sp. XN279]NHA15372.1 aminoacyltransferase [Thioalkalivibrio sp. XN279]